MGRFKQHSHSAYTLVEVLVIIGVIALLVAVAIPNFVGGGHTSPANACINNLRQIDAAENYFAVVNHLTNGATVDFPNDLTPYIKLTKDGKIPGCPAGGVYHIGPVGTPPTCSLGTTVTPAHVLDP